MTRVLAGMVVAGALATGVAAADVWADLGVRETEARTEAVQSVLNGSVPHLGAAAFKRAAPAARVAMVQQVAAWAKALTASPAFKTQYDAARALLKAGANPNALEIDRYDIVTIASVANDIEMLKLALAGGALAQSYPNRPIRFIIPFALQFGLYVSPVGFSSTVVPEHWRWLYSLNPVVGVIDGFRWSIIGGESPIYWPGFLVSLGVVAFFLWLGIRTFRRTERGFSDLV